MTDSNSNNNKVTISSIEEIAGVVPNTLIESLLQSCQPGKIGLYSRVSPVVDEIISEGWSAGGIILQVPRSLYLKFGDVFVNGFICSCMI